LKRKIICFIFFIILVLTLVPTLNADSFTKNIDKKNIEDDWYYLPSYSNYCPNGLPDFDQRQDDTWKSDLTWSFCGPTALADIIWWFDSKHSDSNGKPGDGFDNYSLVKNYNPPGEPNPGPNFDDHNFNNINDLLTSWNSSPDNGELIEKLATYVDIYWHKIPFLFVSGTDRFQMTYGAKNWIKDAGLEHKYKVENIFKPSFSLINNRLRKNNGIVLKLGYCISRIGIFFPILFGHYVAVAGINSNGFIAISDPEWDIKNPCNDTTLHNDASIVSHDEYQISYDTPFPSISSWWIPNFERHRRVIIMAAIIISEIE